jgi:hypothetical protein
MLAQSLQNAISVKQAETLPNGVKVVMIDCCDYYDFTQKPHAVSYEGQVYGRTGWNSDKMIAYYRTDKKVAFSS